MKFLKIFLNIKVVLQICQDSFQGLYASGAYPPSGPVATQRRNWMIEVDALSVIKHGGGPLEKRS